MRQVIVMRASRCCVAPPPRWTRSPPSRDSSASSTSASGSGWPSRRLGVCSSASLRSGWPASIRRAGFSLGERLLGFGGADGAHIAAIFRPTIERVARATDGETVDLSVLRGQRMWFVDQIESTHRLRAVSAIGVRFPLHTTANGKAALAALSEADAQAVISRFSAEIAERLRAEIGEIRRTGIAFDREEHTPGISAAAIARRANGDNVIAISVPAPTERFLRKGGAHPAALRAAADSPAWTR